jgi:hypothetical protein
MQADHGRLASLQIRLRFDNDLGSHPRRNECFHRAVQLSYSFVSARFANANVARTP